MSEPTSDDASAGAMLRAAREQQGLHIAALAAAIKVTPRKLDALEHDRWDELPDATFTRALAQLAKGVCQARAGQWADAERTLSRSYELDPSNPVTAFNLAEVLLRRGELERARFYVRRINAVPDQITAQSLWLAARIDRRMGNIEALQDNGRQLRDRFPQAPETLLFERGRFDE